MRNKSRKVLFYTLMIVSLILIPTSILSNVNESENQKQLDVDKKQFNLEETKENQMVDYIQHNPIKILNDSAFGPAGYNFPGIGTISTPYLITGINITASDQYLIIISGTTKYFTIKNCYLNGMNTAYAGIGLGTATHGKIIDNTICSFAHYGIDMSGFNETIILNNVIYDCRTGITLSHCHNNVFSNNNIYNTSNNGIYLFYLNNNNILSENVIHNSSSRSGIHLEYNNSYNTILGNMIYDCQEDGITIFQYGKENSIIGNTVYNCYSNGISLLVVKNNTISSNKVYNTSDDGIYLYASNDNTISNNNVYNCSYGGIRLRSATNNSIINNNIINNSFYGLYCNNTIFEPLVDDNTIKNNNFIDNNLGGTSQAYDNGTNNYFSDNYWNEWTTTNPYPIDDNFANYDLSPKLSLIPPTIIIYSPLNADYTTNQITVLLLGNSFYYWYYIEKIDNQNRIWTKSEDRYLKDGEYALYAYGSDLSNNIVYDSVVFTIDTPPPIVKVDSPRNKTFTDGTIIIDISGDAEHYWYFITSVDADNVSWDSPQSRTLINGTYSLIAYGNDSLGNEAKVTVVFTIEISESASPKVSSYTSIMTILLIIGLLAVVSRKNRRR